MNIATLWNLLCVHNDFKYESPLTWDQETTFCM